MDGRSADAAFSLLGEATRMTILQRLWAADADVVAFAELRKRVGARDSGRFNYHLNELDGHFVSSVEDGWRLTQAGREVVRAVAAGSMTERPEMPAEPLDAGCVDCDGALLVSYEEYAAVECADCGATVMWNEFPPAGLQGRDPQEAASAFDRWTQARFRLAMDGICPNCAASVETTLQDPGEEGDGAATIHRCPNCKYEARAPLFGHLLGHPAVISFYHDHGVDVTSMPYWDLRSLAREFDERVVSREPWRAEILIAVEGDTLSVVLDDGLQVIHFDVEDGEGPATER